MTIAPFARPMYVMAKPAASACNLRCDYCYYLEKAHIAAPRPMSDETLEVFVRSYIQSQTTDSVLFTWHGGEPLLRPISFYQKVLRLQEKYAEGRAVDNCIQTNGTLINAEWARFFRDNHWLVGVSIDGPEDLHDEFRHSAGGGPSWRDVMRGIGILNRHSTEWNAMATVNDFNVDYPADFYHFFRDEIGCRYLQFTPVVERLASHSDGRHLANAHDVRADLADFSVTPDRWGDFLCQVFDIWVRHDVGDMFVQLFDATLAGWAGVAPGVCSLAPTCGHAGVIEANGDVYSCDHFVFPEYRLGNIHSESLVEMMYGERQKAFGAAKQNALPAQCRQCKYIFLCNGECPRNRFVTSRDGEPGLNYLCDGYMKFWEHSAAAMFRMKELLDEGLPPSMIMDEIR